MIKKYTIALATSLMLTLFGCGDLGGEVSQIYTNPSHLQPSEKDSPDKAAFKKMALDHRQTSMKKATSSRGRDMLHHALADVEEEKLYVIHRREMAAITGQQPISEYVPYPNPYKSSGKASSTSRLNHDERPGAYMVSSSGSGGMVYSSKGISTYTSDGRGNGMIHGPGGISTFTSDGRGNGIINSPNGISTVTSSGGGSGIINGPDGITTFTATSGGGIIHGPDGIRTYSTNGNGGIIIH